jgi:hypothetical protein
MARRLFADTEVTLETTLQEMTRLVRDLAQGGRGT